jgi:geranylgeranyl diphosphate synthase type I
MDLSEFKIVFDNMLSEYVQKKINDSKKLLDHEKLNKIIDYIHVFMFSGWKRIRPYVLYLTYKWLGWKNQEAIMRFGMIFELLHSMALIHDDIIDKSDKRHNVATMHHYTHKILDEKDMHIAWSQALLVWDLLLSRVYELWYQNHDFEEKLLYAARQNVHYMIEEVILGQMIDVHMMTGEESNETMIDKKNKYKTASYTFTRPMLTGAVLVWADSKILDLIKELWDCVGMAFQIRDDLKDILWTETDKRIFSDVQEWQQTYFTNYIFKNWSDQDKKILRESLGRSLSEENIKLLQKMFQESWSIDFVKSVIQKYSDQAKYIVNQISFEDASVKVAFDYLIKKISNLSV